MVIKFLAYTCSMEQKLLKLKQQSHPIKIGLTFGPKQQRLPPPQNRVNM